MRNTHYSFSTDKYKTEHKVPWWLQICDKGEYKLNSSIYLLYFILIAFCIIWFATKVWQTFSY